MTTPILLDLPDTLLTPRLLLRAPRPGDGAALHEAIVESLPRLREFLASLTWVSGEQTLESAETYCRNAASNFIARRDLPYLMFSRETQQLLGACGLHRTQWDVPKTEIGYWVRTSAAGQGYVTEAVNALVDLAFETIGAQRVDISTDALNLPSRRVAERCGFVLEGVMKNERRAPDGVLRDSCIYARLPA